MNGSLVYQDYINLINKNFIITENNRNNQIQPSSIDLSLSEECYEIKYSFLSYNSKVRDKLKSWSETRKSWNEYDIPKYDYEAKLFDLSDRVENFLRDTCKTETREAFYKSKKGKEIQTLEELEEKATDLLHSDMIGSEVLSQISMIAKQTNINMTIPQNTLKELPNK